MLTGGRSPAGAEGAADPVNVTAGTIVRIALLVLATVVLQLAVVTQIDGAGTNVDLFPLVTLSVGLLAGPIAGARSGSSSVSGRHGAVQTLGVTSLLLIGVGYLAGRYREMRDASHKLVPPLGGRDRDARVRNRLLARAVPAGSRVAGQPARDPGDPRRACS